MEYLLENRKYVLILARDEPPNLASSPGWSQDWQDAESILLKIAETCHHLSPNNLDVYVASHPHYCYENILPHELNHVFTHSFAPPEIDLYSPMAKVLDTYFRDRHHGPDSPQGLIIITVMDCEPPNRYAIIQLLLDAAKKVESETEIGLLFAQVGEDERAKAFLQTLDRELHRTNINFDIIDTPTLLHLNPDRINHFLLGALFD